MYPGNYSIEYAYSRHRELGVLTSLLLLLVVLSVSVPLVASRSVVQQQSVQPPVVSTVVAPAVVQEPEPEPAAPTPQIIDLQPILEKWQSDHPRQQWGIAVKSLSGPDFQAQINADKQFRSASLYKLFLVKSIFSRYSLDQQQAMAVQLGDRNLAMAECVDLMLRLSDNPCGESIAGKFGWSRVTRELNTAGFSSTDFSVGDSLVTSAGDTALFLEQLNSDMLDESSRAFVIGSLQKQRWNKGIPAGCPDCLVANKTGSLGMVTNDAAIIQYNGGAYVLAILSQGGTFAQIAALTAQIQNTINAGQ